MWTVLRQAPPLPFLPERVHGKEMVALALIYAGDPKQGERPHLSRSRKFGTPVGEHVGVQPYAAWQQAFDPLLTPGARNYWKSHNFATLAGRPLRRRRRARSATLPSPQCEIFFGALGGATMRPAPGRHGVRAPRRAVRDERPRALGGPGRRQARHRLGARLLPGLGALRDGRGLRELPHRRRERPRARRVRPELRSPGPGQARVRSRATSSARTRTSSRPDPFARAPSRRGGDAGGVAAKAPAPACYPAGGVASGRRERPRLPPDLPRVRGRGPGAVRGRHLPPNRESRRDSHPVRSPIPVHAHLCGIARSCPVGAM